MTGVGRTKILVLVLLLAGAAVLAVLWRWLDMVFLGIAIAVVAAPLHNLLTRRMPGWLSALLVTLVVFTILAAGIFITLRVMQENLSTNEEILGEIAGGLDNLTPQIAGLGIPGGIVQGGTAWIRDFINAVEVFWLGLSPASILLAPEVALFLISLALSLWKGDQVLRAILVRFPPDWLAIYPNLARVAVDTLYAVLVVQIIIVGFTLCASVPFFALLGYGHILYLSLVTTFCELVPVLGASVPMVLLLLYALAIGDIRGFFLVAFIGYAVIALLPELTLRPIRMGRRTLISPVVMFIGFMGGIILLGPGGFLLGPLILAVAVSWYRLRKEGRADEPGTPA